MSVRRLAEVQPASFAFTPENEAWGDAIIKKYPEGRQASAVISLLWRAQKQNDYWLPRPAIEAVANKLGLPYIRVLEIATFYTMFNLAPVGKFFVQLCGTTPCLLRGSDAIKAVLKERVGEPGQVTADGLFSWTEVECLGACCNAPMVQINDDYYRRSDARRTSTNCSTISRRESRFTSVRRPDACRRNPPTASPASLRSSAPTVIAVPSRPSLRRPNSKS